ncbi:MAG TPA: WYL domain-containing protein, partial [Gammaproteobacteria bacterium]|nr:WYL domain-containing protein [Gammaproteobacteria bacterium]
PLGIIQRGPVAYLVATAFDYADVRYFALHRIRKAEVLMDTAKRPAGFSLDDHLATGAAHFTTDTPVRSIRLRAQVSAELARILEETALSSDQKLSQAKSTDDILVTASLPDTWQLRWWILSQGSSLEVLAPKALRQYVADEVAELSKTYRKTNTRKS